MRYSVLMRPPCLISPIPVFFPTKTSCPVKLSFFNKLELLPCCQLSCSAKMSYHVQMTQSTKTSCTVQLYALLSSPVLFICHALLRSPALFSCLALLRSPAPFSWRALPLKYRYVVKTTQIDVKMTTSLIRNRKMSTG